MNTGVIICGWIHFLINPLCTGKDINTSIMHKTWNKANYHPHIHIVHYHGNHFLNPIFLGFKKGCHGNILYIS